MPSGHCNLMKRSGAASNWQQKWKVLMKEPSVYAVTEWIKSSKTTNTWHNQYRIHLYTPSLCSNQPTTLRRTREYLNTSCHGWGSRQYRISAPFPAGREKKITVDCAARRGCRWRKEKKKGPAEIWTRIVGFRVRSANRYTTEPWRCTTHIYTYLMQLRPLITASSIMTMTALTCYAVVHSSCYRQCTSPKRAEFHSIPMVRQGWQPGHYNQLSILCNRIS